jgi:hypothetical protein
MKHAIIWHHSYLGRYRGSTLCLVTFRYNVAESTVGAALQRQTVREIWQPNQY